MKFVRVIPVNERLQICTRDKVGVAVYYKDCMPFSHTGGSQPVRHVPHTQHTPPKSLPTQDLKCDRTDVSTVICYPISAATTKAFYVATFRNILVNIRKLFSHVAICHTHSYSQMEFSQIFETFGKIKS